MQANTGGSTGTVTFDGALNLQSIVTFARNYDILFTQGAGGQTSIIANVSTLQNTGTVTFGNNNNDSITFTGGLTRSGGPSELHSVLSTTNTSLNLGGGNVQVNGDSVLSSGAGSISVGGVVTETGGPNTLTVQGSGTDTFSDDVTIGTVAIDKTGSSITFNGDLTLQSMTTTVSAYGVTINGDSHTIGGATVFNNSSALVLNPTTDITFTVGVTATNPSSASLQNLIQSTNADINFGGVPTTLAGNVTIDSGAGAGAISLGVTNGTAPGAQDLTLNPGTGAVVLGTLGDGVRLGDVNSNSNAGGTTLNGDVTADSVDIDGTTTLGATVEINTSVAGGDISLDAVNGTSWGGEDFTLDAGTGTVNLDGIVGGGVRLGAFSSTTSGAGSTIFSGNVSADSVSISGTANTDTDVTVSTDQGGSTGGDVTFLGNLIGGNQLNIDAVNGAAGGTVTFGGTVGSGTPLTALLISTAKQIDFDNTVSVGAGNLDVNASGTITFDNTVTTTGGGEVIITNGGLLTIQGTAANPDFNLDGAFTQDGTGAVAIGTVDAVNITTANADVFFNGAITLSNDLSAVSGVGIGNITFDSTINGGHDLTAASGTGTVEFNGVVGGINPIANLIVTSDDAFTLDEAVTATAASSVTITVGNFTLTNTITTVTATISTDTIDILAGTLTGTGNLILQPIAPGRSVGVGTGSTGDFNLTDAETDRITDGWASITIGRGDGTGAVIVTTVDFVDPVTIQSPAGGGSVSVEGPITVGGGSGRHPDSFRRYRRHQRRRDH